MIEIICFCILQFMLGVFIGRYFAEKGWGIMPLLAFSSIMFIPIYLVNSKLIEAYINSLI